ncbi:MAG TPA: helix-turn-helix transcriptional regulator [Pilimelia sp.]|nr:helix-turn-helix transcriptional regulator [Pilimelia sp.]
MTNVQGPTVGRRRLRTALRRARETADLTQEYVASAMDWSLSKLIRIESGAVGISTNDVRALLQLYRVTDATLIDELVALARVARRRTWWSSYRDAVPPPYASYIGLEAEAAELCYFHPIAVPGLLQTEAYAKAIVPVDGPDQVEPDEIATRVAIRLTRQREVLGRDNPPEIRAVLDEAVLRRVTGSRQIMREQLLHLAELGTAPNITIQVLPFTAGNNTVNGPFVILRYADPTDSDVVYLESALINDVVDRSESIGPYQYAFKSLCQDSLDSADSAALIAQVADELA